MSSALLGQATVAERMIFNPVTIAPDAPVLAAAEQILTQKLGGLPVVAGEHVVGMITDTDLMPLLIADETRLEEFTVGSR